MAKTSVPQSKSKGNRAKPEPVYIPVSDNQDKLTVLRTKYFYLITEAEAVGREIERLGGGDSCKK